VVPADFSHEKEVDMNTWLDWGIPIIEWFQNLGEAWLLPMKFFTFLGTEYFIMLIMPALFWCYSASLGFRLGLILLVSSGFNDIIKIAFGWPRPYWVSTKVKALSTETSYGIPSGHSQNAVVLWGRLATAFKRPLITVICVLLIFFISISRLYLGVHFPTDVLMGWLVGGTLLIIFVVLDRPVVTWLKKLSFQVRLMLSVILPLSILALGIGAMTMTANRTIPQEWVETAHIAAPEAGPIAPQNPEGIITGTGALLGLCTGYLFLIRWNQFNAAGAFRQRIARYVVGVCGVVIIYFGLRMIFPQGDTLIAYTLRFVRYAVVGFWVSYLGPRMFVLLRLA
jgi:membrane-associated phospholipid phosphatase